MKRWKHQDKAYEFLKERTNGALFMDMGTGKSKVMIDVLEHHAFQCVLIVCPKSVCEVWLTQFEQHSNGGWTVVDLSRIPGTRKHLFMNDNRRVASHSVFVCNYESVWRKPLRDYLVRFPPDAVVCDESHRIKAAGSKVSRFMHLLSKRVEYRYCLTGTPLPNSPLDIYGQYRFMNGSVFGNNFGTFLKQYAEIDTRWGYTEIKGFKNQEELQKKIYEHAYRVSAKDVLQLSAETSITVEYTMSAKAEKAYLNLKREGCMLHEKGVLTVSSAITLAGRLQQICSGYAPVYDDNGVETIVEVDEGRKQVLYDLLDGMQEPIVVFCKYRKDIKNVIEVATELKKKVYELSGRQNDYAAFKSDPTGVIVVQIQSGSSGIDLTEARYCIYYSHTYSLGDYEQSKARILRPGQKYPVKYYHIVSKLRRGKTIDETIVESLKAKKDVVSYIMEAVLN